MGLWRGVRGEWEWDVFRWWEVVVLAGVVAVVEADDGREGSGEVVARGRWTTVRRGDALTVWWWYGSVLISP